MSVAASINILLRGNTTDLESKLNKVEKKFHHFLGALESGGGPVLGAIRNAFEQAFSPHALKEVFEEVVQVGRVAERLDIVPEKLAGLQLAAESTGQSFESITAAMQKMLVAVSGSGDPLKKAQADTAFNKLKLSAEELKGLSPDEMLKRIGDAMERVGDVADRVNIAKSIFGKGGVGILNTIHGGSKALEQYQQAAEQTGRAINEIDVGKFESLEKTFKVLQSSMKGIAISILRELGPHIEWLGKLMLGVSKVVLDFFAKWGTQIKYLIELWVVYKTVQWGVVAVERAKAAIEAVNAVLEDLSIKSIGAKIVALGALAVAMGAAAVAIDKALDKFADGVKNIELPELGKLDGVDVGEFTGKGLLKNQHPAAAIKGSVEAYSAVVNAGGSAMSKIEGHTKKTAKGVEDLVNQAKAGMPIKPANIGGHR